MVAGWNPLFFLKHWFHILHFPNSTGLFTKPTSRHYTIHRFSPDIDQSRSEFLQVQPLTCCDGLVFSLLLAVYFMYSSEAIGKLPGSLEQVNWLFQLL